MSDCIFCKIINKQAPATIEAESESVIAFKSIAPVSEHHILIVPKIHIETFRDFSLKNSEILFEMVQVAQNLINEKNIAGGYKLVVNGGKYQQMPHFHWHLLGGNLEDEKDILNKT